MRKVKKMIEMLHIKSFRLRSAVIMIILICWVVPLLSLGIYSAVYYNNSMNYRINQLVALQMDNSVLAIERRLDDAIRASRKATIDTVLYNIFKNNNEISKRTVKTREYLSQEYDFRPMFLGSYLFYTDKKDELHYTSFSGGTKASLYKQKADKKVKELSQTIENYIDFVECDGQLYLVRNLYHNLSEGAFATLVLELDTKYLFAEAYNTDLPIVDIDITLESCNFRPKINGLNDNRQIVKENYILDKMQVVQNKKSITYYYAEKLTDYYFEYGVAFDKKMLLSDYTQMRIILGIMLLMILPMIFMVIWFFHLNVNKPINNLVEGLGKIEKGKLGATVEDCGQSEEFKYLADSFNAMSSRLQYLFERVYAEQLAHRDAKIMALQSRINPHFLNNTLELMNWQARIAGDIEVSNMIEMLSTIMDATLDRSDKRLVTLNEELKCLDAYLYIVKLRFGNKLVIDKEIDERLTDFMVPSLVLQPIIENAVEHGIQPAGSGKISIKAYQTDKIMHIDIINNGRMLSDQDVCKIEELLNISLSNYDHLSSTSIGIKNVNERIRLLFGDEYGLKIFAQDGQTVSRISLPFCTKTDSDKMLK